MKTCLKKLLVLPLLLALAVTPAFGQSAGPDGNAANQTEVAPLPVTNAPAAATNTTPAKGGKPARPGDDTSVRIGPNGIHIGGPNPVEIGGLADGGPPFMAALVAIVGIIVPFLSIVALAAIVFYAKHRKNKMLHETLRAMVEKGVPIPPELLARPELIALPERTTRSKTRSDLRGGLVMLGIGSGLLMLVGKVGWICIFIGVALELVWLIERKTNGDNNDAPTNKL